MSLESVSKGIEIISRYYKNPKGYNIGAEHHRIYLYATDLPVSNQDISTLIELGWFQEEGISEDGGDYDRDESWTIEI